METRIRVIGAANVGDVRLRSPVDPSLLDIYGELRSLFSFNSYRVLQDMTLHLTDKQPVDIIVHPGRSFEITLVNQYKNLVELRVRVKREGASILVTHVRLAPGRTVLIGGPRHGEGTLIFAISGRF